MKQLECMIAWTPANSDRETAGHVEVGPWPDKTGWSNRYSMWVGAGISTLHKASPMERLVRLFLDFNTLVVRDGIDPQIAHRAFLKIKEYRTHISPDMDGATVPLVDGRERKTDLDDWLAL